MAKEPAKDKRPAPPPAAKASSSSSSSSSLSGPESVTDADWDDPYGPNMPDLPAGETMPPRAARTASQNGPAMRNVFAYLLDEDAAPPPPSPPKKKR